MVINGLRRERHSLEPPCLFQRQCLSPALQVCKPCDIQPLEGTGASKRTGSLPEKSSHLWLFGYLASLCLDSPHLCSLRCLTWSKNGTMAPMMTHDNPINTMKNAAKLRKNAKTEKDMFSAALKALSSPQEKANRPSGLMVTPRTKPCDAASVLVMEQLLQAKRT